MASSISVQAGKHLSIRYGFDDLREILANWYAAKARERDAFHQDSKVTDRQYEALKEALAVAERSLKPWDTERYRK